MLSALELLIDLPDKDDVTAVHSTVNSVSVDSVMMMSCDTITS